MTTRRLIRFGSARFLGLSIFVVLLVAALTSLAKAQGPAKFSEPPGRYRTSWVGNSLGGDGGSNGAGRWVQNGADEIEVTPDGTIFAGVTWDEAGRCAGLYKDGRVNNEVLKHGTAKGRESAWGWGTANNAVAASGSNLYLATTGKRLVRFRWTPGDLESAVFVDDVEFSAEAVGLAAGSDILALVFADAIEVRRAGDLAIQKRFRVDSSRDAAIGLDGSLWILAGNTIRHYSADGNDLGVSIPGLETPTALSIDPKGRLIVCEGGRRQQVITFDVSAAPKKVASFGEEGGMASGIAGKVGPAKLFGLRGAGFDLLGNLYVALSFGNGPNGNLMLRSFDPTGHLRWEMMSLAFVDTFGFDPDKDGTVVYGRTSILGLDLSQTEPGREWSLKSINLDPLKTPEDDRLTHGQSVVVRNLKGRRLVYMIGQNAAGYRLYTFDGPDGQVARPAGSIGDHEQWAWDVADDGAIWHGDAPGKTIRRYPFRGWLADGSPDFDWKTPQSWPWPDGWELVRRILYDDRTDSLYVFGYLKGEKIESWGVVGRTGRRYDGWLSGKKSVGWTRPMPLNPSGNDGGTELTPKAVDLAGDYLFVGMVKPDDGKQHVHILGIADGHYVGTFTPGPEVGGNAGWEDMPYAVQALRKSNGEYLVLVEEDFRGKNLLYRWSPGQLEAKSLGR